MPTATVVRVVLEVRVVKVGQVEKVGKVGPEPGAAMTAPLGLPGPTEPRGSQALQGTRGCGQTC
jgi:hypothetical protein